jgi:hypothetical protein
MHITVGYQRESLTEREECFKNACDHARRAHLDYLKHIISHIHNHLNSYPDSEPNLHFQKDLISARLTELKEIGESHEKTIEKFHFIIDAHWPPDLPIPKPADLKVLSGRIQNDEVLCAANIETARIPNMEQRALLWQWARLETILTALTGQKTYMISYRLLDSYIKYVNLTDELKKQIVDFKIWIMGLARKLKELQQELGRNSVYTDIILPAELKLNDSDKNVQAEAFKSIEQNIDTPFDVVKNFLGFPFE